MLAKVILKIQTESKGKPEGATELLAAEMLTAMCRENPNAARAIAESEKTLTQFANHLYEYAKKHRNGNSYAMTEATSRKLAREFYKIPEVGAVSVTPVPDTVAPLVDILDFL